MRDEIRFQIGKCNGEAREGLRARAMSVKKLFPFTVMALFLFFPPALLFGQMHQGGHGPAMKSSATEPTVTYPSMPEPGKKVPIEGGSYLIYGFDKALKMGTVIMKVEVFNAQGKKDTGVEVKADAGMPSMRGAHETGERAFQLSNKGDYLLPIGLVMPGDWEIRLTVLKDGKVMFRGRYNFNV
jgi:hypothetical protein